MSTHEMNTHELSGDDMIIIDGENVETVSTGSQLHLSQARW
jgi:hypothetical protein